MALELFNDMNVQMGGKKGRRRKGTRARRTKGKRARKGTQNKKRKGGSLFSLIVPTGLLGSVMYMQQRKKNRSRKVSRPNKR
jgi:hypothetical protein